METALLIIQLILALMFTMAGIMKLTIPINKLVKTVTWTDRFPVSTVRFIGVMELIGAIGLIIPWALDTAPVLTLIAAGGLTLIMILAIFHHLNHKENKSIVLNIVLMILAAFVVYGRFNLIRV